MLDESELRSSKIHVERAKFEVKGTFNPELKRKRKKLDKKDKQKQVDRLLNWEERPEIIRHKYEKTIVMKNMFDLQQFKVIKFTFSIYFQLFLFRMIRYLLINYEIIFKNLVASMDKLKK